jgi:putative hydrolase of the HAD superfamily
MNIRLVLFDLDDTLFNHRGAVDKGIASYVTQLGAPYSADGVAAFWNELEERHYHRYLGGELDFEGQRRARAIEFADAHGVQLDSAAAGAWFNDYFEHYVAAWALHDDALPCLEALRAAIPDVRFGLITNGETDYQLRKVDAVGLRNEVEHIVASGELGIVKPDPRIFEHACALFGVEPAHAAYVGDRFSTDAVGAAKAGLRGVWLDRTGRTLTEDEQQVLPLVTRIGSLAELPSALLA